MGTSEEMTTAASTTTAIPTYACYGEEANCDVIFLAGREDDDVWRLPAHKFVLTRVNPVFRAMMLHDGEFQRGDVLVPHTIRVTDVDCRALDNLLRFLYNEPVSVQSVETALYTLYAADKYICPGLTRLCVSYLIDNLNLTNALSILKYIRVFSEDFHQNLQNMTKEQKITGLDQDFEGLDNQSNVLTENTTNSTPVPVVSKKSKKTPKKSSVVNLGGGDPKIEVVTEAFPRNIEAIDIDCASLLQKCLLYVDSVAEDILASEEFEDLDISAIQLILGRDTLNVSNENIVFSAVMRWADKECKRKQKPLTSASKREVLSDAIFLPRYLIMKRSDFLGGPAQSGLFNREELHALMQIQEENEISLSMSTSNNNNNSGSSNSNGNSNTSRTDEADRIKNIVNSAIPHAPVSLQPHIYSLLCKRKPVSRSSLNSSRPLKKNKNVPFMKRLLCFKNCCNALRSPPNSNQSSPVRTFSGNKNNFFSNTNAGQRRRSSGNMENLNQQRPPLPCGNQSNPSAFNSALNGVIICWAFFFD